MKKSLKMAAMIATVLGMWALAVGPVSHGPVEFPDDSAGGNIVAHGPVEFPDDSAGGNVQIAHGPVEFPDDSAGGNINS
jgi:hypothetical protein